MRHFPEYVNRVAALKLIRDAKVKNRSDLAEHFVPADLPETERRRAIHLWRSCHGGMLQHFADAGLVEFKRGENWAVSPMPLIDQVFRALELSLTDLASRDLDSVQLKPIFGRPSASPSTADVFVLMPFLDNLKPVYEDHIVGTCDELDLSVARADDFFAANAIVSDIWNAIYSSSFIMADCTKRNPNVFYEIGVAHTVGKPTVLISQDIDDVPFDLRHLRCIVYDYTPRGMSEFQSSLKKTLQTELSNGETGGDTATS